ncbi:hypothetical protein B0H66DRAFT_547520 [Apodospora peruviana]|uniref:Pentatricopeptide repeat domain-containing protein n=1 Tax=Apodospora peruviana TaxID=516989 RepID=A0AAE0MB43_9PEZI|nr:hypothetical protein B0H66DRAFT_547520 [Apodospora peruviana]
MSLGIKQLWRFWPHANGASRRISVIPRDCLPAALSIPRPALPFSLDLASHSTRNFVSSSFNSIDREPHPSGEAGTETLIAIEPTEEEIQSLRKSFACDDSGSIDQEPDSTVEDVIEASTENMNGMGPTDEEIDVGMRLALVNKSIPTSTSTLMERFAKLPVRRHREFDPVVVKPFNEYPSTAEYYRSRHWKFERAVARQNRIAQVVSKKSSTGKQANWRDILRVLYHWTPTYTPEFLNDAIKIIVPADSPALLSPSSESDHSIFEIQSRTACRIKLQDGAGADGHNDQILLLSGQPPSIDRAVQDILKVTPQVTVIFQANNTEIVLYDGKGEPSAEMMQSITRTGLHQLEKPKRYLGLRQVDWPKPYLLTMPVDDIPVPKEWTKKSFERYVFALTMGRPPQNLHFKLSGEEHNHAVRRKLLAVFSDPTTRPALTNAAFKLALIYLANEGARASKDLFAMFNQMLSLNIEVDAEVYDILAKYAKKAVFLTAFQGLIMKMIRHGRTPTFDTWIRFLGMIQAEEIRRYILHCMYTKGFFNEPTALRRLARELASNDIYRSIQLGHDFKTFVTSQNELYGSEWLYLNTCTRIMDVLGGYGRFDDINELLEIMWAHSPRLWPNEVSLNTILTHCKVQQKFYEAIGYVKLFEEHGFKDFDPITFHLLNEMAWRRRSPHVLSVVFRCAHLAQSAKWRVRHCAAQLLEKQGGLRLTKLLKIRGVEPAKDLEVEPEKDDGEKSKNFFSKESIQAMQLAMQNLLLCDYKAAHRLPKEKLLPRDRVGYATEVWYVNQFYTRHLDAKLGDLLAEALERDLDARDQSKRGIAVELWPPVKVPTKARKEPLPRGSFDLRKINNKSDWVAEADMERETEKGAYIQSNDIWIKERAKDGLSKEV